MRRRPAEAGTSELSMHKESWTQYRVNPIVSRRSRSPWCSILMSIHWLSGRDEPGTEAVRVVEQRRVRRWQRVEVERTKVVGVAESDGSLKCR